MPEKVNNNRNKCENLGFATCIQKLKYQKNRCTFE